MNYLMGIDLGTSSTKTVIVDLDGNLLALAQQEYALQTPQPGWAEQSPETWQQAAEVTMSQALERSGLAPEAIAGIGLAGWPAPVDVYQNVERLAPTGFLQWG